MNEQEIWKNIESFEGIYQVSNYGRIKSLERKIKDSNKTQTIKERILKPFSNGRGYLVVHLRKNNKRYVRYVHKLVVESFIGKQENMDVNHKDFNRKNNYLYNLEYCTRKENINYSKKCGRYNESYKNRSKILEEKCKSRLLSIKEKLFEDYKKTNNWSKTCKKFKCDIRTLKKYNIV